MIELSVEGAGLGRARFVTDPLWEAVASLAALNQPTGRTVHRRLAELRRQVDPHDLRLLTDVCGDHEWLPDFVTPQPDPSQSSEPLDQIRRIVDIADMDVAAADLAELSERRTDSAVASMAADEVVRAVADALARYWTIVLAPLWARIEVIDQADIAHRSMRAATHGLAPTIDGLHERLDWHDDRIRIACSPSARTDVGQGIWLVPSVFRWPGLIVQFGTAVPVISYPARGAARLWDREAPRPPGLDRLLGVTRARVLAEADLPSTTTALADTIGCAKATVSEHLAALSDAGLLHSWRDGRQVFYERTPLGDGLLSAGTDEVTSPAPR